MHRLCSSRSGFRHISRVNQSSHFRTRVPVPIQRRHIRWGCIVQHNAAVCSNRHLWIYQEHLHDWLHNMKWILLQFSPTHSCSSWISALSHTEKVVFAIFGSPRASNSLQLFLQIGNTHTQNVHVFIARCLIISTDMEIEKNMHYNANDGIRRITWGKLTHT